MVPSSLQITLAFLVSSPLFLSFLPCLSLFVPVTVLDPESRLNIRKIGVLLAIPNFVSVDFGWGSMLLAAWF
jgi:hypothetical protein